MLAKTEAMLLLDVDFLPSESLVSLLRDPSIFTLIQDKRACVVPAFGHADYIPLPSGTDLRQREAYALLDSKAAVVDAYFKGRMPSFYEVQKPGDHGPTNYSQWATASRPYDVEYERGYEPYILIAKKYVPWYDERFVGYCRNKVSHLEHISSVGIQFAVHPDAYVIHRPYIFVGITEFWTASICLFHKKMVEMPLLSNKSTSIEEHITIMAALGKLIAATMLTKHSLIVLLHVSFLN